MKDSFSYLSENDRKRVEAFSSILTKIEMSKISDVLTKNEINRLKSTYFPEQCNCHYNAAMACLAMERMGIKSYFCDGYFKMNGIVSQHAFNVVKRNNKEYYIDFSHEWACGNKNGVLDNVYLIQRFTGKEIFDIFNKERLAFCPFVGAFNDEGECFYYKGKKRLPLSHMEYENREHLLKCAVRNIA